MPLIFSLSLLAKPLLEAGFVVRVFTVEMARLLHVEVAVVVSTMLL